MSSEGRQARLDRATEAGVELSELVQDPSAFADRLRAAFADLAEAVYREGQQFVAPGIGLTHGVRLPYQAALRQALLRRTRHDPATVMLLLADRLLREPELEARWLAMALLERTVVTEPERSWQLIRRAAADAGDWITVDTLAHPAGKGILSQAHRWEELEQLTISPSRWERRLVGSTIATIPFVDRRAGRAPEVATRSLALLALLIGEREPDVQKALAWAYRSMALVDRAATTRALEAEAETASATADGHRAWVIRDALPKLSPGDAARIRQTLAGIRRRPGAPSTSTAAGLADRFEAMGLGRRLPEPPL
ncbi:MAG TPA: DNA alkylation repair protein [Candidatus Limnocylindrales bacterium]|nr:DNA alkylation repair protein [Candidatus Limnocylindrales bacterium]